MSNEQRFDGVCKECGLDFGLLKVAELDCKHPTCPAYSENSLVRVEMAPCGDIQGER